LEQLGAYAWPITLIWFYVAIDIFLPLLRIHRSDEQFDDFIRGLELELPDDDLITAVLLDLPGLGEKDYDEYYLPEGYNEPEVEESEVGDFVGENGVEYAPNDQQYTPAGQPVPLGEFCQPITSAVNVDDVDCNICGNGVTVIEPGDQAVVTVCMHYFHATCLTFWVNDSAADNSNNCPHCRTRLWGRRPRTCVVDNSQDGSDMDDNSQEGNDNSQDQNDNSRDENDGSEDENDGSEDENGGSEDGDDGFEDRQTALQEYIMLWRAAAPPVETPTADTAGMVLWRRRIVFRVLPVRSSAEVGSYIHGQWEKILKPIEH
jgi:hypothetical protein